MPWPGECGRSPTLPCGSYRAILLLKAAGSQSEGPWRYAEWLIAAAGGSVPSRPNCRSIRRPVRAIGDCESSGMSQGAERENKWEKGFVEEDVTLSAIYIMQTLKNQGVF